MRRRGALSIAALSMMAGGCSLDNHPLASTDCIKPSFISQSVAGRAGNVLSALAYAMTRNADSVVAHFGTTQPFSQSSTFSAPAEDSVRIPMLGLAAETGYQVQLLAVNRCGS